MSMILLIFSYNSIMKWFFTIFLTFSVILLTIFGINCVYGFYYPVKYQEEIASASEFSGLDEAVIYSIINTESRFNKDAVSTKGAVGLMQVLPSTASEVAKKQGIESEDYTDPETNIKLGSLYLKQMLDTFKDLSTAVCAYNAGPAKVRAWLNSNEFSDDGITLKAIPFKETENYLQKFQKNLKYYSKKIKKSS